MHLITEKIFLPVFAALPLRGSGHAGKYMMTAKPLCWVPYYTAEITYKETKPCCKFNYDQELPYPDIRDFYSSHADQWRRDSFEQVDSLLPQCSACSVPKGVHSYERQHRVAFQKLGWTAPQQAELRKIIIGMDNICSSSCIQCGPHFSTTLSNLATKSSNWPAILGTDYKIAGLQQLDIHRLDGLVNHLEVLHLYGGEPLISPNLIDLIELVQAQSPKLRKVTLNTGLGRIRQRNIDVLVALAQQKKIEINVSVSLDGPLELNHWIRDVSPEEFHQGWLSLVSAAPWISIGGFQTTLGTYNIMALGEYVDTVKQLWKYVPYHSHPYIMSTAVLRPETLNPRQLPQDLKQLGLVKLQKDRIKTPTWVQELFKTANYWLQQPQDRPWEICLNRVNAYPQWRGSTTTWQDQWDRYVNPTLI